MQEDTSETTIKTFKLNGNIKKIRDWESKMLALSKPKDYCAALTTSISSTIT
jgi:hypothetical protein